MSEPNESTGTADERSEYESSSFEDGLGGSNMRREAKIGLAVITVLFIAFGVILYNRLTPADDDGAASAGQEQAGSENDETPAATQGEAGRSPARSSPPSIFTARGGSDHAPEKAPSTGFGYRGAAGRGTQAEESGAGIATVSSPPSFVNQAEVATPSGRYAGYGGTGSINAATDPWPSGRADPALPAGAKPPYGSFGRDGIQAETSDDWDATSQAADLAGPNLSGPPLTPVRAPDEPPQRDRYGSPSPWQTSVSEQASATDSTGRTGSSGLDWRGSSSVDLESGRTQGEADPPPMPAYGLGPRATSPTMPGASGSAPQVGVQAENPYATDTRRRLVSPAPLGQSDSGPPQLLSDGFAPAASSQQDDAVRPLAKPGTYLVEPNDNYWVICGKLYGSGAYFRALAEHNRAKFPDEDRLRVGDEILAPDVSELERSYADLCPKPEHRQVAERRAALASTRRLTGGGSVYVVQQGDNLFDIARYELGKASRWAEVLELNRDVLGNQIDYLTPGMKLILPGDQTDGTVTQRPGLFYQR